MSIYYHHWIILLFWSFLHVVIAAHCYYHALLQLSPPPLIPAPIWSYFLSKKKIMDLLTTHVFSLLYFLRNSFLTTLVSEFTCHNDILYLELIHLNGHILFGVSAQILMQKHAISFEKFKNKWSIFVKHTLREKISLVTQLFTHMHATIVKQLRYSITFFGLWRIA